MNAIAAGLIAAGLISMPFAAAAQESGPPDHEAGVPLTPAEAAGVWTVESAGRNICTVTLGADHTAKAGADCNGAIPGAPTGWQATHDGMQLVDAGGQRVIGFNRWSNSLFVSHQKSGVDIQLRRGGKPAS